MSLSPRVFAHRGSSAALPEHTLAAYRRALAEGSDGLECDVRLTRDGHLVCLHDGRLDRTSNGRGPVSARTLAELSLLDFGSWHPALARGTTTGTGGADGTVGTVDPDGTAVLTLDRLLCEVRAAGRPVHLLIETKHPNRYGAAVERRLVMLLREHGLAAPRPEDPVQVTVMSFSPLALRRVHLFAPRLPTVLLLELLPPGLPLRRVPFGARAAGPGIDLVRSRPGLVRALRDSGTEVFVWTVNEPDDLELVLDLGVEGIITDRPRAVLDRLGR